MSKTSPKYNYWHDQVAKIFHQELAKQLQPLEEQRSPYYKHEMQVVPEMTPANCTGLYLNKDKPVHFNRPDITLTDKINKETAFIDTAIPLTHGL